MLTVDIIDCGTLVDGVSDSARKNIRIVIEDGRIREVDGQDSIHTPADVEIVDHKDEIVIPGMIDAHVHVTGWRSMDSNDWMVLDDSQAAARATADLRALLATGFTSIRDVGSRTGLGLRNAIAEGEIPGPRVYTSELGLSQTAGHEDVHHLPYDWVKDMGAPLAVLADGVDECRRETRKRIRKGVDLIKIQTTGGVLSEKDEPDQPQFTPEEVSAITDEAHRAGIPVASHAQHSIGVKLALENGVDTIEHGFVLDEECIELMLDTDATFVPTFWAIQQIHKHGNEFGVPDFALKKAEQAVEDHLNSIRRAYEAGVPIALGTDIVGAEPLGPHGHSVEEAISYVDDVGMTEMEAIQSATSVATRTLPENDVGSIQAGNHADLVVLGSDPLSDINALTDIQAVYKNGKEIERLS